MINRKNKKGIIHFYYIVFLLCNFFPLYLGKENTQLSYALRDFQVISLSISFFVGLFVINDQKDVYKFVRVFVIAFILRELFLLFTSGPEVGYLNRLIALADTSQTSYLQNLAIYYFLYKFLTVKDQLARILNLGMVLYLSLTLLALGKMGGILSLIIGLLIVLKYSLSKINFLKYASVAFFFLIILVYLGGHEYLQNSFGRIETLEQDISLDDNSQWRLLAWEQGIEVFRSNMYMGGGYSWPDGWLLLPTDNGPQWAWGSGLHNEYLHILSSGGIVNFILFMIFIAFILFFFLKNMKRIENKNNKIFASIFLASFVSFLITGFTNPAWIFYVSMVGWSFGAFGYRYVQLSIMENSTA